MSRRDFWICLAIIVTIFALGVMVGMCMQVLGITAHAATVAVEVGGGHRSGMPCENREQFERWYAEYEQETMEEVSTEATEEIRLDSDATNQVDSASSETAWCDTSAEEMESEASSPIFYTIGGELIDPEIQQKLYRALEAEGIDYWYTGALAQMYQESRGQQYAVNPNNGIDCGLYQYRSTYWTEPVDIFDVDAQLHRYAVDMAARFNAGLTVDEAISRHNTSDHITTINWEYVSQVKQWLNKMEEVK